MALSELTVPVLLARLDGTQLGFPAASVREIVRAVAIAPFPGAPRVIEGVINLHGRLVPVIDIRERLALPPAALAPDQFLVALQISDRLVAVRVDDVEEVTDVAQAGVEAPAALSPVLQRLQGVAPSESGALVIYDMDAFLTQAEREAIDQAEREIA